MKNKHPKSHSLRRLGGGGLALMLLAGSLAACTASISVQPKPGSSSNPANSQNASSGQTGQSSTSGQSNGQTGGVTASADSKLSMIRSGNEIANGATYLLPDNSPTAGAVAIFSEIRERIGIANNSGAPVQVEKVEILGLGDVKDEEYILQATPIGWRTDENPDRRLELPPQTLKDKEALDLYIRFYPVAGGERKAQLVVTHDGGKKFVINLVGKGRPNGQLLSKGTTDFTRVAGTVKDELTSTMLGGSDGSLYFSANQKEILDKYYEDILVAGLNGDGSRKWAKVFNGPFKEFQPDPGQNNETGGDQHAMAMGADGMLYIVGSASAVRQNNLFYTLVLKVDPKSGQLIWGKIWNPADNVATIKTSAAGYGIDVADGKVYVTGTTGSNRDQSDAHVLLLGLDAKDGALSYQKSFELAPGYNDRGYAIKADGKGGLYIGGLSNGDGFLLRVKNAAAKPELDWAKNVGMGVGSNVNGIDVDAAGNAYLSLDRRGATTFFSTAKISPTGSLVWGKTYDGGNLGAKNNSNLVRVYGDRLFVGGRIGQSEYDGQMGDGFLAELDTAGALKWSTFHFNGKGPDELSEHRVKGVTLAGNSLYVGGQVYTGSYNHKRYDGYWYDGGSAGLADYAPALRPIAAAELIDLSATGRLQESTVSGQWVDAPESVTFQNPRTKEDGSNSDGEFFVSKFTLK